MLDFKKWTATLSGASLPKISTEHMLKNREIGKRGRLVKRHVSMPSTSGASEWSTNYHASSMLNTSGIFTMSEKAKLFNRSIVHLKFSLDNHRKKNQVTLIG